MLNKDKIVKQVINKLADLKGIAAIYLYGSLASGHFSDRSDVDIAILFRHDLLPDALSLFDMKGELEALLGRDVDLVVLNDAGPLLAMQIIERGEEIALYDKQAASAYKIRLVTDYADMKDLLKPFEEKYFGK